MFDHETAHNVPVPLLDAVIPSQVASEVASQVASRNGVQLGECIQQELGRELSEVERLIAESTRSKFPQVDAICHRAASMGGKRLRPVLLLLSAKLCHAQGNQLPGQDLWAAAAAVELVHAASLVHDDLMDHAAERRHQPTIAHQYGDSAAVLLGDFLFTRAYSIAASCKSTYVARQIAAAATQLCEGELRQQFSAANWSISAEEYRSILVQKTAALCEVSCRLGAWRSHADAHQRVALSRFGRYLGLAFQIFDDWLDYWGDDQVGKTLGTDLAQFKPTLPLIRLLAKASPKSRSAIADALACGDQAGFAYVRRELDQSDAGAFTLKIAESYAEKAKRQLQCFSKSSAQDCLLAVADYSVKRSN